MSAWVKDSLGPSLGGLSSSHQLASETLVKLRLESQVWLVATKCSVLPWRCNLSSEVCKAGVCGDGKQEEVQVGCFRFMFLECLANSLQLFARRLKTSHLQSKHCADEVDDFGTLLKAANSGLLRLQVGLATSNLPRGSELPDWKV